ncbi:MAG: nicotinamide riboside transporter PnuC [Woeseiaceae bacterium]|nr:nicotinamide riboside transporter PnuC [Woeseiaceae bacterium]
MGDLLGQLLGWSPLEVAAVVAAILYLLLAIRENIWCWLFAGISTAIYVYLFVVARLYMESALNVFYFVMAVYGFTVWYRGRTPDRELPVTVWPGRAHGVAIGAILLASLVSGYLLDTQTDAAFPYIDSLTTWSAIWATFLVARKVLENWWYWLVIDIASVFIYWSRDLQLTSLLFVVYVIMIPFGLILWTRSYREASA